MMILEMTKGAVANFPGHRHKRKCNLRLIMLIVSIGEKEITIQNLSFLNHDVLHEGRTRRVPFSEQKNFRQEVIRMC